MELSRMSSFCLSFLIIIWFATVAAISAIKTGRNSGGAVNAILADAGAHPVDDVPSLPRNDLCKKDVRRIKKMLRKVIFDERIPHVVRLAFHDCVGGCDGCLNRDHPFNNGAWVQSVDIINQLYDDHHMSKLLSRADFYVLAAIVAIEEGVENANRNLPFWHPERMPKPRLPFLYGRQDCPSSPSSSDVRALPSGNDDHAQVFSFFLWQFQLDPRDTVALLGAHTLGKATGSSGWKGFWKEDEEESFKFDNRYYEMLIRPDLTWRHVDKSNVTNFADPRWQWEGVDEEGVQESFMLNADVALFLKIEQDSDGRSSCDFSTCARNPLAESIVNEFAEDKDAWMDAFRVAFRKMTSSGQGVLRKPSCFCWRPAA